VGEEILSAFYILEAKVILRTSRIMCRVSVDSYLCGHVCIVKVDPETKREAFRWSLPPTGSPPRTVPLFAVVEY
jgi:hypothetical protein